MFAKILECAKVILLAITVWILYSTSLYLKHTADESLRLVSETKRETLNEVREVRKETFLFLGDTRKVIDNRLDSIQRDSFKRIDRTHDSVISEVHIIGNNLNSQLTQTNKTVEGLAKEYSEIPKGFKIIATRFDDQTNCTINDLCWQNITSDLLIDTRSMVRNGTSTFRQFNSQVPSIVANTKIISDAVAINLPPTAASIQKTADHIQKITTPHWYDRLLSYSISGGLLYFTAKKP